MSAREVRQVEWVDSVGQSGWNDLNATLKDATVSSVTSVGYVLREDSEHVLLVQSFDATHDNVDHVMAIPKVAITREITLRKAKP